MTALSVLVGRGRGLFFLSHHPWIGVVVLPAGASSATAAVRFPTQPGRLRLREITFSPGAPFLCGSSGLVDPRVDRAIRVGVRLCFP